MMNGQKLEMWKIKRRTLGYHTLVNFKDFSVKKCLRTVFIVALWVSKRTKLDSTLEI